MAEKIVLASNEFDFDFDYLGQQIQTQLEEINKFSGLMTNPTVETLQTLQSMIDALAEKSLYAVQIGQDLKQLYLQKCEQVNQITGLNQQISLYEDDLLQKKQTIDELLQDNALCEKQIQELKFENQQKDDQLYEFSENIKESDQSQKLLSSEYAKETHLIESLQLQIQELSTNHEINLAQFQQELQDEQQISKNKDVEIVNLKEVNSRIKNEFKEFQQGFKTWEKSFKSEAKLKVAKIDRLQCELEQCQEVCKQKDDEIQRLKLQNQGISEKVYESNADLNSRLDESYDQIQSGDTLNQSLTQLNGENMVLQDRSFLELDAHDEFDNNNWQSQNDVVQELNFEDDENVAAGTINFNSFAVVEKTDSDLHDLIFEKEQSERSQKEEQKYLPNTHTPCAPEWRDPEEEYFRLSVLSLKMQYNDMDKDFVFSISSKKLFKACKQEKVPFHKWYVWIDQQLLRLDAELNPNSKFNLQRLKPGEVEVKTDKNSFKGTPQKEKSKSIEALQVQRPADQQEQQSVWYRLGKSFYLV